MMRWIGFFVAIITGLALGLYYGWVVNPVRYVDASFSDLHEDFKSDYVWMVAEAYQAEQNTQLALERLKPLGDGQAWQIVHEALLSAIQSRLKFRDVDLQRMRDLENALRAYAGELQSTPTLEPNP
jgi:hypothetical protein